MVVDVAMINDCAYVGETLLKYLPSDFHGRHIKRTRGFWSKTFGLAYEIMRVKADVYHVHYLLQDCYIAAKLGKKPLIGHAHGSDLRSSLNHPLWGRIVRHNLKKCDKVIVSTPDILSIAKKFRENAEYLPNPVDTELFYPKPFMSKRKRKRVLVASNSDWNVKGTDLAIRALSMIKDMVDVSVISYGKDLERTLALASSLGLVLNFLPKVPHERLNEYYWSADVVIDQFRSGVFGMIALEAIGCGRPVVTYISSEYREYEDFPLKDVHVEEEIAKAVSQADAKLWQKEYAYVEKNHKPEIVVQKLLYAYNDVAK
jgi:glycosyltransferase involved in cell wall biosynthesis